MHIIRSLNPRFALLLTLLVGCDGPVRYEVLTFELVAPVGTYGIRVAVPPDYAGVNDHATIYVLDSPWYFDQVAAQAERLRQAGYPSVLVVGIGWGRDREVDYTPTVANLSAGGLTGSPRTGGGGADEFMEFLAQVLIPYMEHQFAVNPYRTGRTLLGHSLGGLFVAHAFVSHPDLFANYLMLSPSVWYDDALVLHSEQDRREELSAHTHLVYLSHGELEPAQLFTAMLGDRLERHYPGSDVKLDVIRRRNHSSSASPAITAGLEYYFDNRAAP